MRGTRAPGVGPPNAAASPSSAWKRNVVLARLGHVGELHAQQLARRGERPLDGGRGPVPCHVGERVERARDRLLYAQDAVHRGSIGILRPGISPGNGALAAVGHGAAPRETGDAAGRGTR